MHALIFFLACTTVEKPESKSFSDTRYLVADLDGAIRVLGQPGEGVEVTALRRGHGSDEAEAQARLDQTSWSAEEEDGALRLDAEAPFRAEVDLEVQGPEDLDTWIRASSVEMEGLRGAHVVSADRLDARGLGGWLELHASTMDLELAPAPRDDIFIDADGDLELGLPWGMPYDLQVWGAEDQTMVVEDLGWSQAAGGVAYFAGRSGDGSVRITIEADGPVEIHALW